ncbi:GerMN domain-containing protein [Catellatospora sp. KI3]|uniref:GerMN domain-containing protein n=1 Tax=Catellatospora sp. KI3 TaxID=3041620 RepID=UPI0024822450|nr:GerMN domain-containing protein [Catellatospora sp. KI3]MDI1461311.1 GerMN domain-containing protein [Catellatospora sp. KI3]
MTTHHGRGTGDEVTEQLLRQTLEAYAATVGADAGALSAIRTRVRERTWWHRLRGGNMPLVFTTGTASAVAATVAAVVFGVGSCAPPTTPDPANSSAAPGSSTSASPAPDPATSPTPGGTPSSPGSPSTVSANVPIYYQGELKGVPKLYREYHRLAVGDGGKAARAKAAVTAMLDGRTAYDPDYISTWPASARLRGVKVDGATVTVDLSGAAVNGYDPPSNRAALQQLIWTATAASDTDAMVLLLDGKQVDKLWNQFPVRGPLRRGPAVDVLAPVWVIDPQQNAVVAKGPVTIKVAGIVYEATMRVRVRDAAGKIVFDRSVNLDAGPPSQGAATVRTPALPAGKYSVEGFYYSPDDSSIQALDEHQFTVG